MKRLAKNSVVVAVALMGSLFVANIAEAKKPLNPIERRLSPNKGFFEKSTSSKRSSIVSKSFLSGWSLGTPLVTKSAKSPRLLPAPPTRLTFRNYVTPNRSNVR